MPRQFRHLTYSDRIRIESLRRLNTPVKRIAAELGVSPATVYNEIRRGLYDSIDPDYRPVRLYSADRAQRRSDFNRQSQGAQLKLANDHDFVRFVEDKILRDGYSPDAVLGYIRRHDLTFRTTVCKSTLYSYIDKGLFLHVTNKDLPFHGKRKRKTYRTVRPLRNTGKGKSIEDRPPEVRDRSLFGHWEMDSVIGRQTAGNTMLVFTERKTNMELIFRAADKTAMTTQRILNRMERHLGSRNFRKIFQSITCDNGCEFNSDLIETSPITGKKRTDVYFCHPFCSSERGSNEKQNQMIRRKIQKGTRIESYTDADLKSCCDWLNDYPRKKYDYATSRDLFNAELRKLGISSNIKFM